MAKSAEDVPQDADMEQIPRWARVVLAARTLRRVQPLLLASWPKATKKYQRGIEWAILEAELAASQAAPTPDIGDAAAAAGQLRGTEPMRVTPPNYLSSAAALVASSVVGLRASLAQHAIEQAVWAVDFYEIAQKTRGVTTSTVTAIWRDFNHLKSIAKKKKWTDKTAVTMDVFGAIWPKGPPANWPKDVPPPIDFKPKRRREKQSIDGLGLPQETVDFLESGKQLEFDPTGTETGRVRLKPVSHLFLEEFPVLTEGTTLHHLDPHKGEEGFYYLRAIDLAGESDSFPYGLLLWMPDYKKFGAYDRDHAIAHIFPRVSWFGIVASPAEYLNAQWHDWRPIVKYLPSPWKHCEFRK